MKIKKSIKKLHKFFSKIVESPPAENTLYAILISLAVVFGALLWGVGEKISREEIGPELVYVPSKFERNINQMVSSYPIKEMVPQIAKQDRMTAAYLIAIGKKESAWGKKSPQKDGHSCYNYWGYRGDYNQTDSGYSCFDSPDQAVAVVGGRIGELIAQNIDSPKEMVVWKCGADCSGHDPDGVKKWIRDVRVYFNKTYYE